METVGIRELRNRLSEYVRRVRDGETILVTSHGEPVAELRSPSSNPEGVPAGLAELERRGIARSIVRNDPALYRPRTPILSGTTSRELLDWVREDRRAGHREDR
jgi:prevent-host-death family protein